MLQYQNQSGFFNFLKSDLDKSSFLLHQVFCMTTESIREYKNTRKYMGTPSIVRNHRGKTVQLNECLKIDLQMSTERNRNLGLEQHCLVF